MRPRVYGAGFRIRAEMDFMFGLGAQGLGAHSSELRF